MTLYRSRQQFIHYTRAGHIASAIVNIVIIVTTEHDIKQSISTAFKLKLAQTLMYLDIYSVTHTVHSLNGSKSHTLKRDTKLDNISTSKD